MAAAVLLAGGGGAYWASSASDDGGSAAREDASAAPEPLVLDGAGRTESGDGGDSRSGVAPGEPNPNGHTTYRADGKLPDGPDSASVFRRSGSIGKSEVTAVAKALGVPGTPKLEHGRWTIAGGKEGPSLSVGSERAAGMWTYSRQADLIDMTCGTPNAKGGGKLPDRTECAEPGSGSESGSSGSGSGSGDGDGDGEVSASDTDPSDDKAVSTMTVPSNGAEPVSEEKAKDAVRPVLEALDLKGAELDASSAYGSLRVVNAQPEVEGLPTHDWGGTFTVGPDGKLSRAHGKLGELKEGAEYPVMSAADTLKQLNKYGGPRTLEAARCAVPPKPDKPDAKPEKPQTKPAPGGVTSEDVPCGPSGTAKTLSVTGAEFGLATQFSHGKPVLVPSWIYEVQRPGGKDTYPVTYPAVEPEYLDRTGGEDRTGGGDDGTAEPPSPDGPDKGEGKDKAGQAVSSYKAEGRKLTVTFWGGVCHKYAAKADESGDKVTVTVEEGEREPGKACVMIAKQQTVDVTLDKPLGDREVVDARDGEPLPQRK
ncbi:hypothetical protein DVA86_09125 [Streptomyces armeniacus]|uniref:Large membrane protein n=1 Tax=Streptomyces armeniacus TaxID=83291 RepID=A0A345XMB7_9ACTN|nr:hypothetical protein DVA86_09125 [Streptomyces armeniacus]